MATTSRNVVFRVGPKARLSPVAFLQEAVALRLGVGLSLRIDFLGVVLLESTVESLSWTNVVA